METAGNLKKNEILGGLIAIKSELWGPLGGTTNTANGVNGELGGGGGVSGSFTKMGTYWRQNPIKNPKNSP